MKFLDFEIEEENDSIMNIDIDSDDFYRSPGISKKIKMNDKLKNVIKKLVSDFTYINFITFNF
jgi:hypothetical protein